VGSADYSATLSGNPFLFFEAKTVASMILNGKSQDLILKSIFEENLFQYKTTKSIPKRVNTIFRRLDGLDPKILERLVSGSVEEGKLIVLLIIARSDRLFREFLREIYCEKIQLRGETLTEGDLNRFFNAKAELSPKIASWTTPAIKKLKQVYLNILVGSGLLNNRKDKRICPPLLDPNFRAILFEAFGNGLVLTLEGKLNG